MGGPLLSPDPLSFPQRLPFPTSTTTPAPLVLPKTCRRGLSRTRPSSSQPDPLSSRLLPRCPGGTMWSLRLLGSWRQVRGACWAGVGNREDRAEGGPPEAPARKWGSWDSNPELRWHHARPGVICPVRSSLCEVCCAPVVGMFTRWCSPPRSPF